MSSKLVSIKEAAELAEKSTQTIRRLIKGNKVKFKKRRTPQGFNYQVDKESLAAYFDIDLIEKHAEEMLRTEGVFDLGVDPDLVRGKKKRKTQASEEIPIPVEGQDTVVEVKGVANNEGITIEETIDLDVDNDEVIEGEVSKQGTTDNSFAAERFATILEDMLVQHQEDKARLFALLEQFQKRTLILEERIKKLEAPKRAWWKMW